MTTATTADNIIELNVFEIARLATATEKLHFVLDGNYFEGNSDAKADAVLVELAFRATERVMERIIDLHPAPFRMNVLPSQEMPQTMLMPITFEKFQYTAYRWLMENGVDLHSSEVQFVNDRAGSEMAMAYDNRHTLFGVITLPHVAHSLRDHFKNLLEEMEQAENDRIAEEADRAYIAKNGYPDPYGHGDIN